MIKITYRAEWLATGGWIVWRSVNGGPEFKLGMSRRPFADDAEANEAISRAEKADTAAATRLGLVRVAPEGASFEVKGAFVVAFAVA